MHVIVRITQNNVGTKRAVLMFQKQKFILLPNDKICNVQGTIQALLTLNYIN
jgi:hypothetical protein